MKRSLPPWFWRGLVGVLIGSIISYGLFLAFAADTFGGQAPLVLQNVASVFFLPILGLLVIVSKIETAKMNAGLGPFGPFLGAFFMIFAILFYPVFMAAIFSLGGAKQARRVMIKEAVLVGLYVLLMVIGIVTQR